MSKNYTLTPTGVVWILTCSGWGGSVRKMDPTWLYAGGSRVWQRTFAAAACSVPAPSIDPFGIDAGSGDNAVSRHSGR